MIRKLLVRWVMLSLFVLSSCSVEPNKPSEEQPVSQTGCSDDATCQQRAAQSVCVNGGCQCQQTLAACPRGCSWSGVGTSCQCVELSSDPKNCGSCGNVCDGQSCCNGQCCAAGAPCCDGACCLVGQSCCQGQCADLKSDSQHCGRCGRACAEGETCCNGTCVDTRRDLQHCGACGQVCPTASCCDGQCCPTGRSCCGKTCIDTKYNTAHCGACGKTCATGEICCGGTCVDASQDQHCGRCGNRCSGLIPPQSQTQAIQINTTSPLKFHFEKLPRALDTDEITVTVEIFGDFGDAERYADVWIAGVQQQRIQGGEPTCNWARSPSHTGRYRVEPNRLLGGQLDVEVHLSAKVEVDACVSLQSRVMVTLSYGGRVCCNQRCVQRSDDAQHCGACGTACAKDTVCCGGRCCQAHEQCTEGECSQVLAGAGYWIHHLVHHPTRPLFAAATSDGLELWDRSTRKRLYQVYHKAGVNTWGVAFHPNGDTLATASTDGVVQLWDTSTGKPRKTLFQYPKTATFVAFSPDGTKLASASLDGSMHMWDVASGQQLWTYTFGGTGIHSIVFAPRGTFLVAQASSSFLLVMDLQGKLLKAINMGRFSSSNVASLAIRPNGAWLAVGMQSREIHILELTNYTPVKVLANPGVPNKLSFDVSGKLLAAASSDKGIWIWDVDNAQLHKSLFGHQTSVTSAAFHPTEMLLISGATTDRNIRVWRIPAAK